MPNNRNAEKAMRQSEKRRLRNRAARTSLRTVVRKARDTATETDPQARDAVLRFTAKRLDQAAAKHLIHKNKAARLKSRIAKRLAAKPQATA